MESKKTFHCDGGVLCSVEAIHEGVNTCARESVGSIADGEDGGNL